MEQTEVIDRAAFDALMESIGGDREFLGEMLETYFDDAPKLLATLHASLAASDAAGFRRAAHSLKSTSASLGALVLSRMCRELEEMGKAGVLDGADAAVVRALEEYARVRAALEAAAA